MASYLKYKFITARGLDELESEVNKLAKNQGYTVLSVSFDSKQRDTSPFFGAVLYKTVTE